MLNTEERVVNFSSRTHPSVAQIRTIPGHFATINSHTNYYIDLTTFKSNVVEAKKAAYSLAQQYVNNTQIDCIVCLDGTEVIGAFLAEELCQEGLFSANSERNISIIKPELTTGSQLLFRDNLVPLIHKKKAILLMASITTGVTVHQGLECIEYYGGEVVGISSIFSGIKYVDGIHIDFLFDSYDILNYDSFDHKDCPYCKKKIPVEALVNAYGYSGVYPRF